MTVNVAITQDTANPYSGSSIRFNPADPSQVIAAPTFNAANPQAQYHSSDGGSNWVDRCCRSTPLTPSRAIRPWIWQDLCDGSAWALTIGVWRLSASPTSTSGASSPPTAAARNGPTIPRHRAPTQAPTSRACGWITPPHPRIQDNMYAIWHEGATAFVSVRQGLAGMWSAPLAVSGAETTVTADGGDIKTNANGRTYSPSGQRAARRA